jgi:hypothetical protein
VYVISLASRIGRVLVTGRILVLRKVCSERSEAILENNDLDLANVTPRLEISKAGLQGHIMNLNKPAPTSLQRQALAERMKRGL